MRQRRATAEKKHGVDRRQAKAAVLRAMPAPADGVAVGHRSAAFAHVPGKVAQPVEARMVRERWQPVGQVSCEYAAAALCVHDNGALLALQQPLPPTPGGAPNDEEDSAWHKV